MTPFRNIIVAYDGSDRAQDALSLALRLRDPEGRIVLACALVERPWGPHHRSEDVPEEIGIVLAGGRAQVPIGIRVALRAPAASSAARALTELAEIEHADLIVIGSSRRIADGRIHLERTAGRLLQGAPCAVAVAPADLRSQHPFRHVAIAYDGSTEARVALAAGFTIAQASGAAVTVAYAHVVVTSEGDDLAMRERRRAQHLLDEAADAAPDGVNPRTLLLHGPAPGVIARACEDVVDLLVCGSRGYGPIERALLGSVAEGLMEGAPHPVLVLPRKATSTGAIAAPIAMAVGA
jgi:nucleotide-binding universal stress UspA family protein